MAARRSPVSILVCAVPGAGRARGQPDRLHHRQPEREECGKKGISGPHGFDAGKKISGYSGPKSDDELSEVCRQIDLEIVKQSDAGKFVVLPKRWIVEMTICWLNRCRRLPKDWECLSANGLAFLRLTSIRLMVRKLCQIIL